jgi:hypothetical protein
MLGTRARTYDYDFNIRLKVEDINKSIKWGFFISIHFSHAKEGSFTFKSNYDVNDTIDQLKD